MNNEIRLNKKFFSVLIAVLIFLVASAFWMTANLSKTKVESKYSAVYLATGEIYFGELHRFPRSYLSNAWLLQRSDPTEDSSGISIIPFNQAFWGPIDKIYLNPEQIIFTAKLRNDSQVKDLISGGGANANLPSTDENSIEITP